MADDNGNGQNLQIQPSDIRARLTNNKPFLKIHFLKFNLRFPEGPCNGVILFFSNISDELSKQLILIGGHYPGGYLNHIEGL